MSVYPSRANKDLILAWCLANPNALRVYADGWVMCDIPAYNAGNATDFVEETYIPVYYFQSRWTSQPGYVGFSFLESWQTPEASNTLTPPLDDEKRAYCGVNSGKYIIIDNTTLANPFDDCFYNFMTRRGDPCGFDPSECCGSSSSSGDSMIALLANKINENQNHSISPVLLTNAAGAIPSAADTIQISLYQNGTAGQLIAQASYPGGSDIEIGVTVPASSSANLAFVRPDGQNVSLVDFDTAFAQYVLDGLYVGGTGQFSMEEFDKIQWAMDFAVRMGPIDGFIGAGGNMTLDKVLVITITTGTNVKTYQWTMQLSKLDKGWTFTSYVDVLTDGQDIGMGFACFPGSGIWTGNLFTDIKQLQPILTGNLSALAPRPAVGTLRLQEDIMYYWKCSIDQNFTPVIGSSVDRISRCIISAPAAYLGTQVNNTAITILTPDNNYNENVLDSWTVSEVAYDSGTPDASRSNAQWDIETTLGESNIWAQDSLAGFYLMEWNGATWVKTSPADFALGFGNILKDILFGTNPDTGNPYMVTLERNFSFFNGILVTYWEQTGATRNDPASWTGSVLLNSSATFDTLAGVWPTGVQSNNIPVFRGITYYDGSLYEFAWDGLAWVRTQITSSYTTVSSQENQCLKYFNFVNAINGNTENEIILAAGRRGFNSSSQILVEYDIEGAFRNTIHQRNRNLDGKADLINIVF